MQRITVRADRPYDVLIGKGLLDRAGALLLQVHAPSGVAVVTDDTVAPLYLACLCRSLEAAGFCALPYCIAAGEESKSMAQLGALLEHMAQEQLTRSDIVVALGGGVVNDLAGFGAAVYLRGVPLVQIPTTLLGAIDSAVGGKTGVNLRAGKNLAGAFHQPKAVIIDPELLQTLPTGVLAQGVAEAIKYGVLCDPALFALLAEGAPSQHLPDIIARCVSIKAALVAQDEFDRGERRLLNLGHTLGHAVEQCSGYTMRHGAAVAIGMVLAARGAMRLGLCDAACVAAIEHALRANGLDTACPYPAYMLVQAAQRDKKREGEVITLVLPTRIGACILHPLPVAELEAFIAGALEDAP